MERPQFSMNIAGLRAMIEQEDSPLGRFRLPTDKRTQELIASLPKISETELKDLGHSGKSIHASYVPKLDRHNRVCLPHML
jgi:hypothetical protein